MHTAKGEPMDYRPGGLAFETRQHLEHANHGHELQDKLRREFGPDLFADLEAEYACPEPEPKPQPQKKGMTYKGFPGQQSQVHGLAGATDNWDAARAREQGGDA